MVLGHLIIGFMGKTKPKIVIVTFICYGSRYIVIIIIIIMIIIIAGIVCHAMHL